ncbi:MAG: protein translocase subunit SecF [Myxococcales bacterium]|nr:protein translocase subunit SecF [Myxococcales bacterium]USN51067.1 MAG: protein translocase subunit SecF [Myxococcales bacterium]
MKFITIFDPRKEINFVGRFKTATGLSLLLPLVSFVALLVFGIPWGIDFLGGLEMQVKFPQSVPAGEVRETLENAGFSKNQVQQFGASQNNEILIRVERVAALEQKDVNKITQIVEQSFGTSKILFDEKSGNQLSIWLNDNSENITDPMARKNTLKMQQRQLAELLEQKSGIELRKTAANKDTTPDIYGAVMADEPQNGQVRYTIHFAGVAGKIEKVLAAKFGNVEIRKVDFVDSQVSQQLRTDGLLAVIYSLLAIVVYVAVRFDLFFSPGAIVALISDVMGALMVFTIGRVEFDTPSIAALLTILGYSINNTIIIYDRIREDVPKKGNLSVEELKPYVNKAINQTFSRTINSTLTTLMASSALWIFATGTIENFAMVLTIGIIVGALTSLFVSPAAYLMAKKYFKQSAHSDTHQASSGHTREEKAKGVV